MDVRELNEALWLVRVRPEPPSHGGCVVSLQLPESSLRGGLASVAKGDSAESAVAERISSSDAERSARNGAGPSEGPSASFTSR